jgi:hypothetical protein
MDKLHSISKLDELSHAGKLSGDFGHSLIQQYNKKNDLSEKQWVWVHKLIDAAEAPAPEMPKERVGDFSGVIELFTKAKGNLKYPKISLVTESGGTVMLSLAGAKAAKPGTITVTDGKPFGENVWYGRVDAVGNWEKSYSATDEVGKLLKELSLDPAGFATNYGHKHGSCCFCNKTLTHENSVTAGFGPVCADNWGLTLEWKDAVK